MNKKYLYCFFIVALCVFQNSCEPVDIQMDKEKFDRERAAWNSLNLKNYQFTYQHFSASTGPFGPYTITVRENEETVVENTGRHADNLTFKTIEEVYAYAGRTFELAKSVKDGSYDGHKLRSIIFNITYDAQHHYPTQAELSTRYVDNIVGGANYTLMITEFMLLD
jgi:hypothetical protein